MKVIVTQADLEKLVRKALPNLDSLTELTVVFDSPAPQTVGNYVEGIQRAMYEFPRYNTDQKILAIKRFRELVPGLGLAEAKNAIENPSAAIAMFLRNGNYFK